MSARQIRTIFSAIFLVFLAPSVYASDFSIDTTDDFNQGEKSQVYVKDGEFSIGFYDDFDRADVGSDWDTTGLDSATITSAKLVTEGPADSWNQWQTAAALTDLQVSEDFDLRTHLEWVERASDLCAIYVFFKDDTDYIVYAGHGDSWASFTGQFIAAVKDGSSWSGGQGTSPASGNTDIRITRTGSTYRIYEGADLRLETAGTTNISTKLGLSNTRYTTYNGKTAKWSYVWLIGGFASGNWTSAIQTMPAGERMAQTTIYHSGLDATNHIDKIEWLVGGQVKAAYETDITNGAWTAVLPDMVTSGSFANVDADFQIKVYLVGDGSATPVVTKVEGETLPPGAIFTFF
ncbi:hypothetical protein ACFLQR_04000 [Verrucomicrobiota bacterium]